VLNDALEKHPHPEIFNTDQGSQYTSEIHTKRLKDLGITISMDGKGRATSWYTSIGFLYASVSWNLLWL
jgi:putative transposase